MKKQIAKFISDYYRKIITYPSLMFVYVSDSMIALTFYSIITHIMVIVFVAGLYEDTRFSNTACRRLNFALLETVFFLIILGITKHWYTFIVTAIFSSLLIVYIYDQVKGKVQKD